MAGNAHRVPYLTDGQIEREATALLDEWTAARGETVVPPIPVDDIIELHLELTYEIDDLREQFGHNDILGAIWFNDAIIRVDRSLDPDQYPPMLGRYRFTLAHEAGHWRLHRAHFLKDLSQGQIFGSDGQPSYVCRAGQTAPEEVQANRFAAAMLMPRELVRSAWRAWRGDDRHVCVLDLDVPDVDASNERNQNVAMERFCKPLAEQFEVSAEAMRLRLEAMDLLVRERPNLLFD